MMGSDITVSSTSDNLAQVREAAGFSPESTPEEQAEQQEISQARIDNGNRSSIEKMQLRIDRITGQRYEQERRAEAAERERNELRQRLEQMESAQTNGHLDRALAAEYRAAELEERLRAYEQYGSDAYANAPPATPEEQSVEQIPAEQVPPPPPEQQPQQQAPPTEEQRRQQQRQQRFLELLDKRPDAEELVKRFVSIPVSPELERALSQAILNTPNSVEVAMHLVENFDVMQKISKLSPDQAQWELARLSGRLEANNSQPRPVVISKAPPPIPALSGHPMRQSLGIDDPNISQSEFRKIRDQQERDWRRGVRR